MSAAGVVVGVYGKVESQADFLRSNAGEFSQAGMDRWFQEALETVRAESGRLPEAPTGFVLAPPESPHVFIGAFAPSTDAVGRTFPLVIFAALPKGALDEALPAVWGTYATFMQGAAGLAMGGAHRVGAELIADVESLGRSRVPLAASVSDAVPLEREPARQLTAAWGGAARGVSYALRTFTTACDQASKTGPDAKSGVVTIDAPVPTPASFQFWLELAQRRLRWREGIPSILWLDGDPYGRMLLTLGAPSNNAFAYLANPGHRSPRFWPLRTQVASAMDQAMAALASEQQRLLENPLATLGDLVSAFG